MYRSVMSVLRLRSGQGEEGRKGGLHCSLFFVGIMGGGWRVGEARCEKSSIRASLRTRINPTSAMLFIIVAL